MGSKRMDRELVALLSLLVVAGSTATYFFVLPYLFPASTSGILCPKDGSPYVFTPIGTRSENFLWRCLQCGYSWQKTYPDEDYQHWRRASLEPSFVRDYTLLYLRDVLQLNISDPFLMTWISGEETFFDSVGSEVYVYRAEEIVVTIKYACGLSENVTYKIKVEVGDKTLWEGELRNRQFVTSASSDSAELRPVYDYYGGVGLFKKGIHIVATSLDPTVLRNVVNFTTVNDYWNLLKEKETNRASTEDFISIIISRGDYSTGGYTIQVKAFSHLETYPTTLMFDVNFTDPGEGVIVTEAFTNPMVLVPIGRLSAGKYVVEVHIDSFILTYDSSGKPVYTPVQTFVEEVWKEPFEVIGESD